MNKFKSLKVLSIVFLVFLLLLVGFDFLNANNRTVKILKDVTDTLNVAGNLIVNENVTAKKFIGDGVIPSGAIMAFLTQTCPTGWSPPAVLEGKFLLGKGGGPNKAVNTIGGSYKYSVGGQRNAVKCCHGDPSSMGTGLQWENETIAQISVSGDDDWAWQWSSYQEHLPPFYAVLWCMKN